MKSDKKLRIFSSTHPPKRGRTKGQVKLSFGMLFSIILIIFFITFAFFVIQKFLDLENTINVGKFVDDFQSNVDKLWMGSQGAQELEYSLSKKIELVCFINFLESKKGSYKNFYEEFERYTLDKNLFFHPIDSVELNGFKIEHIDFGGDNPLCFEVENGKVKIGIEKDFGEALISVTSF